jgi:hypothetical protein
MKTTRQVIPDAPKNGPKFPCACGEVFDTAEDFGNHFSRVPGGTTIDKCVHSPAVARKLRKVEAA